jgi:Arc/MetJ-type ribon-helix-helix transcriptional regulator
MKGFHAPARDETPCWTKLAGYPNRSRVIQEAVAEKLARIDRSRLARECAKLEPTEERALAEEGMSEEMSQWPTY